MHATLCSHILKKAFICYSSLKGRGGHMDQMRKKWIVLESWMSLETDDLPAASDKYPDLFNI